ncbi:MAG TPA: N-terminal phage integrase SAM-like domain-containing protein [Streptosporangiaceae bacterium]
MPKLRDGVIRRGGSWSYVIRVPDPATGVTKPKWVGGFPTEEAAKAARDEARVRARRGEYVTRSTSTVADYLTEWLEAHAATVKPKTFAGYRHDIDHYIVPRIGRMRLQGPATGRGLQALPRPGRARWPGRPGLVSHHRLSYPPHAPQGAR